MAYLKSDVWSKALGGFFIFRQRFNNCFLGVHFHRYDGNPSASDPAGALSGWSACLSLPFFGIAYRNRMARK